MKKIILNEAEQKLAIFLAKARYNNARKQGKPDLKIGGQSTDETDLNGIAGEIVVCKHLGVYPDTDTEKTDYPKFDLISKFNKKIDVKTTKYKTGKLLATLKKNSGDCDFYFLVIGEFPDYSIFGYAKSKDLINKDSITELNGVKGYSLEQNQLTEIF